MDNVRQLNFLTHHFNDMRNIRFALAWVLLIFACARMPWTMTHLWVFIPGVVFSIVWFWIWQRHYGRHYGHVVSAHRRKVNPATAIFLMLPALAVFCFYAIVRGQLNPPLAYWGLYLVPIVGQEAIDSDNPYFRRLYYAGGVLIISAGSILFLLGHGWSTYIQIGSLSICITMLALSLVDHWLLVHTFAQVSRGENA